MPCWVIGVFLADKHGTCSCIGNGFKCWIFWWQYYDHNHCFTAAAATYQHLCKLHSNLYCICNLSSLSRQDAVILRRLRIGHTRLTHPYLLNRQDQPQCSHCDCALTVAHVLLECNHYNVVRQRYFNVSSLHELFNTVNAQNILGFIRDIGRYRLM